MINDGRLKLHTDLCEILGTNRVYFQPPESIKMVYPAIVYSRDDIKNMHASDNIYDQSVTYKVTVIDHNPDSVIVEKMSEYKHSKFVRHYVVNGLNHDQFTVVFKK